MGWGSAIAGAFSSASQATKEVAQKAANSASTAWNYTKQKSGELYDSASDWAVEQKENAVELIDAGQDKASKGIAEGKQWASEKAEQGKAFAQEHYDNAKEKARQAADWTQEKYDAAATKAKQAADYTSTKAQETSDAVGEMFDKIGESFTPQVAGSSTGSCPLADSDKEMPPPAANAGKENQADKPPPSCMVSPVTVKCGHSKRGFVLKPPSTPTNKSNDQIIQVIADINEHEHITVSFACGECPHGNGPDLPYLDFGPQPVKGTQKFIVKSPASPGMPLQSGSVIGSMVPYLEFARHFWGPADFDSFKSYPGSIACCEGGNNQDFEVQVFPTRKWKLEFSAGVTKVSQYEFKAEEFGGHKQRSLQFKLSGSGEVTYGVRTASIELPTFSTLDTFVEVFGEQVGKFTEHRLVKIKPLWPKVKVTGQGSSTEVKGRYNVRWKGSVSASLSPLIGLQGQFDALQWLIDFACIYYMPVGGDIVADGIKYIRDEAEKGRGNKHVGVKAVARLDIIASGKVSGGFKYEWLPEQQDVCSGEVVTDLDLKVEGKVSGEVRVLRVSYEAGATINAKTGMQGKLVATIYGENPGWSGGLYFKGLTIEGMAYQSLGGSTTGMNKEGKAEIEDRKEKKSMFGRWWKRDDEKAKAKDKASWKIVIIKKYKLWPTDSSGSYAAGGGGGGGGGGSFGGGGSDSGYTPLAGGL